MAVFFTLMLFVSIIVLILGLISPKIINKFIKNEKKYFDRKKVGKIFGLIAFGFFALTMISVIVPAAKSDAENSKISQNKPVIDNLWISLDKSLKTKEGYSIQYDPTISKTVIVQKDPKDAWNEKTFVETSYQEFVKFGKEAFQINDLEAIDFAFFMTTTDEKGSDSRTKGVQITMSKADFQKINWDNLKGKNIFQTMEPYQWIYTGILNKIDTNKLILLTV